MSNVLAKTPWVDRSLKTVWERVVAASPRPEWAPRLMPGRKFSLEEYGCGHYGCVFPTSDPAVVAKLTSDPTEAFFVAAALSIGTWPEGIVRYHAIYRIPGEFVGPRGGRIKGPLFVLWREAATEVGGFRIESLPWLRSEASSARGVLLDAKLLSAKNPEHTPFTVADAAKRLAGWARRRVLELEEGKFMENTEANRIATARRAALPWWEREAERLALFLEHVKEVVRQMQSPQRPAAERRFALRLPFDPQALLLASAFAFYLENDLLLADVHAGNIGLVEGRVGKSPVITDPGHAVPLSSRWQTVQVPELP